MKQDILLHLICFLRRVGDAYPRRHSNGPHIKGLYIYRSKGDPVSSLSSHCSACKLSSETQSKFCSIILKNQNQMAEENKETMKSEGEQVEVSDRGLFDFMGKKKEEEKAQEEVLVTGVERLKVEETEKEEEKKESILDKLHRSNSSSSSSVSCPTIFSLLSNFNFRLLSHRFSVRYKDHWSFIISNLSTST